jgi:hypothetical protein
MSKHIVYLSSLGNPDHGQNEFMPVSEPMKIEVASIEAGKKAVEAYVARWNLGGGNWSGGELFSAGKKSYLGRYSYNGRFWKWDHKDGYGMPSNMGMPLGLTDTAKKAYWIIAKALVKHGQIYTGGCRAFSNPNDWDSTHSSCKNSLLVIIHDGGDLSYVFGAFEKPYGEIVNALAGMNLYVEGCSGVVSGVYNI